MLANRADVRNLGEVLSGRDTVLAVNAAYIASAAQTDATRTEPPIRLQGSYRNMNKIAERIVPLMNDAELSAVVDDHYAGEAQHHGRRGQPAQAGCPAWHADRRSGRAVGGDHRLLHPYAGTRRPGRRPDDPGRGRPGAARGPDRGGRDGDPAGHGSPSPAGGTGERGEPAAGGPEPARVPEPPCEDHKHSTLTREDRAGRITACWVSCPHFLSSRDDRSQGVRRPPAT